MKDLTIEIEGSLTDRSLRFFESLSGAVGISFECFVMSALDDLTYREWRIDRLNDNRFKLTRDTTAPVFDDEYMNTCLEAFRPRFLGINAFDFAKVETFVFWENMCKYSHVFSSTGHFYRVAN